MKYCAIAFILVIFTTTARAEDTLRCGSKIVRTGMTSADVRKFCGKPSATEVEVHDVRSGGRVVGKTELNIWTYNRASGQNAAVLEFDQDKLLSIRYVRK
jgi:hypothetical protein